MKNGIVLTGVEITRIVAQFLEKNGVKIQKYNIDGREVFPTISCTKKKKKVNERDIEIFFETKESNADIELNRIVSRIMQ